MTDHAAVLHRAQREVREVASFQGDDALDLAEAYAVQHRLVQLRIADGEHLTGLKLGFTNRAKMRQMGVDQVIGGQLTTGMSVADGGTVDAATLIHPKVEPEVVFRLARDLEPGFPVQGLSAAVDGIAAGLEVIDSRYLDFRFTHPDVVADNASAAAYTVGAWVRPDAALERALGNLGVVLQIDGRDVDTGSTSAILDNPWRALRAAVFHAKRYGIALHAGDVILAGAATASHSLAPGSSARAIISQIGSATLHVSAPHPAEARAAEATA